jgi:hypothetical protein
LNPFFLNSFWPGMTAWVLLYISDYTMTVTCARMYRERVSEHLVLEGSYEITPYFQSDINSLRKISPRFIGALLFSVLLLGIVWVLSSKEFPQLYAFALGSMILAQLAIHIRHMRNFFTFRGIREGNAVRGRIEYTRPFMLGTSSADLFAFAGFYLLLFVFVPTGFLLGGVATCISNGLNHRRLARKAALLGGVAPAESQAA